MGTLITQPIPDYDAIAQFYRKHWCSHYHPGLVAMIERHLLAHLRLRARILDVCCGTGKLVEELVARGFRVTGVDSSAGMLSCATEDVAGATFLLRDARDFNLKPQFEGSICTFDSLSYFLTAEDLQRVLNNVCSALVPGGRFVFDLSLRETYENEWGRTASVIEADEACFVRGEYDRDARLGRTFITRFHRQSVWERTDTVFQARCWEVEEILAQLDQSGFSARECYPTSADDFLQAKLGPGRAVFVGVK